MLQVDPRAAMVALALPVLLTLGCGGPALCGRSSDCEGTEVCGYRGTCGPLGRPVGARFARSRWLVPLDWGRSARRHPSSLSDALTLGGDDGAEGLLAFGPIPDEGRVLRALLVLHPRRPTDRWRADLEIVVEAIEPFRGGALPPRSGTPPLAFAAARRPLPAGPAHPIRLDVTGAARRAAERDDRRLDLLLRLREGDRLDLASPDHGRAADRPRVELLLY